MHVIDSDADNVIVGPHPNDMDLKRIEHALADRVRYRYVTPQVQKFVSGYLVVSPCCSRNIDPDGGVVDVARLEYLEATNSWHLYRKNHVLLNWELTGSYDRLIDLLAYLNADPERLFWK